MRYYEIRLLDLLGFRPELTNCVRCEAEIKPEDQFFDADHGRGVVPALRGKQPRLPGAVSMPTLKFLRHYQRSTFHEASRVELPPGVRREMETLLSYYLTYLLERRLNSPSFLHEVRRDMTE